jgi:hypothetical protein
MSLGKNFILMGCKAVSPGNQFLAFGSSMKPSSPRVVSVLEDEGFTFLQHVSD